MKTFGKFLIVVIVSLLLSIGCSNKSDETDSGRSASKSKNDDRVVNIYNWINYIAPETLTDFTAATGIRVNYKTYSSNEELQTQLERVPPGTYDLIFPSDYMVQILRKTDRLDTLDLKKVTSYYKLHRKFRNPPFDPGNKYSIPYSWGTSGIAYRADKIKSAVTGKSWRFIFEPIPEYQGKISLLGDMRETMGSALKYLGYSANSTNPDEIAMARDVILDMKDYVNKLAVDPKKPLADGDLWIAHMWSGDAAVTRYTDEITRTRINYYVPREGSIIFIDNMCIPKGAQNKEEAYEFINFVLLGKNAIKILEAIRQPMTSHEVYDILKGGTYDRYLDSEEIIPPIEVIDRCEYLEDVGESIRFYYDAWEVISQ